MMKGFSPPSIHYFPFPPSFEDGEEECERFKTIKLFHRNKKNVAKVTKNFEDERVFWYSALDMRMSLRGQHFTSISFDDDNRQD